MTFYSALAELKTLISMEVIGTPAQCLGKMEKQA